MEGYCNYRVLSSMNPWHKRIEYLDTIHLSARRYFQAYNIDVKSQKVYRIADTDYVTVACSVSKGDFDQALKNMAMLRRDIPGRGHVDYSAVCEDYLSEKLI